MNIDKSYPCPKCGEYRLVYDGMLVWRSGPRPPRKLARKQVGFSPRADYERERLYHCDHCGTEFYQDMEQRRSIHLYEEGVSGKYSHDKAAGSWQFKSFGKAGRKGNIKRFDKAKRRPKVQTPAAAQHHKRRKSRLSTKNKRNETSAALLLIVGFVIIIACSTALMLTLVGTGRDAVARGGVLGAAMGLLGAILNGPRPKSRKENPSVWTLLGHILLLALAFLPGGAVLGVLVGGIYGGLGTGSTVVRVMGGVVSGAVLGGVATILVIQVVSATAAAIGAVRGHWKRHLLVEMADGAKGILFEGGIALVVPGLCIGTLVGIILALVGV